MKRLFISVLMGLVGLAAAAQDVIKVEAPNVVAADEQFNEFPFEGFNHDPCPFSGGLALPAWNVE